MVRRSGTQSALQLRLPEAGSAANVHAVFDLETTGLDSRACVIIEIGWCIVRDGVWSQPRALLVACDAVPPEVQALTGITPEMLRLEGVPLADALGAFLSETEGMPLIGHNVLRFDRLFIDAACRRAGLVAPHPSRYRDTAALYKAMRLGMRPRTGQDHLSFAYEVLDRRAPGVRYSLATCCRELGILTNGVVAHRAAGDVQVTAELYARLTAGPVRGPAG